MSHPNPSHDRENEYPSDNYKPVAKKKKSVKDLKSMIAMPASKKWFEKHGSSKNSALLNKKRGSRE